MIGTEENALPLTMTGAQKLAEPAIQGTPLNNLLFLAVLASSAASLMTTFLPTTRTMLGMTSYGALPKRFASIHPKYLTPAYGTVVAGIVAGTFYAVLTFVSEAVLFDTILSLGLMICFYFGLTAIGCVWYFRKELFTSSPTSSSSSCSRCSAGSGCGSSSS